MGAWRDLINSTSTLPTTSSPSNTSHLNFLQTLKSRPVRTIFLSLSVIFFLSFFSLGGHQTVRSSYNSITSSWSSPSTTHKINWSSYFPSFLSGNPYSSLARYDPIHLDSPDGQGDFIEPEFEKDPATGLYYPPNINPYRLNRYKRANAAFVSLVRNLELNAIRVSFGWVTFVMNCDVNVSSSKVFRSLAMHL
jgi:alpha 1,2-mannosyltransferase